MIPATPLLAGPQQEFVSEAGRSSVAISAPVLTEQVLTPQVEASAITEDVPDSSERIDSLVRPLVESAEQAAATIEAPAIESPPIETVPIETVPIETVPIETVPLDAAPLEAAPIETPPVEPAPLLSSADLPECNTLAEALDQDARLVLEAIAPRPEPVETAEDIRRAAELQAQIVLDSIAQQIEAERAGIGVILASFAERPAARLLGAAEEVVTAPAPAFLEWIRASAPVILPAGPKDLEAAFITGGPQSPTLDGPCLPPQLKNLTENQTARQRPAKTRNRLATLMLSCLIATGLLLGAVTLLQYFSTDRDAKAAATTASNSARTTSGAGDSALAWSRFVEVAGVRVINGANHRPQVQYIVINHSSKELTGLGIRLALRTGNDSSSSAPLFTVFSKVPSLGAYQSREIRTDLDADLRTSSVPDWQSIRTDVQVSAQQ